MQRQVRQRAGLGPAARRGGGGWTGPFGLNPWQTLLALAAGLFLLMVLALAVIAATLPDPGNVRFRTGEITLLDRNGKLIESVSKGGVSRKEVALADISPLLQKATVAAEDRHFYEHHGIDLPRLLKAMTVDLVSHRVSQGGSTITQQLAKVELLGGGTASRTATRKVKEAILATEIEQRLSKEEILRLYLNAIYYGHHAYGAEAAANVFFDKKAKDLTLGQASLLAGLPQAPTYYDPARNYDAAKAKQKYVLDQMLRANAITEEQRKAAEAEDLRPQLKFKAEAAQGNAPHFVEYVRQQLEKDYGSEQVNNGSGLIVTTSLDTDVQNAAVASLKAGIPKFEKLNVDNGAMLVEDPNSGEILAMVGSLDYNNDSIAGQVNIVTTPRQPGSSFKPYDYVTGVRDKRFNTLTAFDDTAAEASKLSPGSPVHDFDDRYEGRMTMRTALVESRNVPAEEAMQMANPASVVATAHQFGISTELKPFLATAIGASEVTMLDHVEAYGVLATQGTRHDPKAILKVLNSERQDITVKTEGGQQVIDAGPAFIINNILSGYNAQWHMGFPPGRTLASKSGTTNRGTRTGDGWLMSYNPDVVIGVWGGHTSNDPNVDNSTTQFFGVNLGQAVVSPFLAKFPDRWKKDFTKPDSVTQAKCGFNQGGGSPSPGGSPSAGGGPIKEIQEPPGGEYILVGDTAACPSPSASASPSASPSPSPSPSATPSEAPTAQPSVNIPSPKPHQSPSPSPSPSPSSSPSPSPT